MTSNINEVDSSIWKIMRPFLIGGFSGCSATTIIQPIDMVKVQIQLQEGGTVVRNPLIMARTIIGRDGILSFYNGLSAGLLRQMTYGLTRLGLFRTLTKKFTPKNGIEADIPFTTKLICSLFAGGIGALIGTPADAALIRMQSDLQLPIKEQRRYKNAIDALFRMAKEEGLKGFFAGGTPTICRGLAINVGMLTTYDSFKKYNSSWAGDGTQLNRFFSGFLSGWVAATISLPFDFVKTRLQKQMPNPDGKMPYKNIVQAFTTVAKKEGPMTFYQGYGTFVIRITPHIMMTWVFMDNVSNLLSINGL